MIDSTFKNSNILIVDDMRVNVDILAGLLEIQGYTNVQFTTDSRLVIGLFHSFKPDLILLDLMMPHLTGFDVMAQLKEVIPENEYLPILVLTADITSEAKQHALCDGAKDFLAKPFDMVEVGLRIDNLLFARYLYQQLQNQNQVLEEKVKERTVELEKINVDLIAAKEKAESGDRLKTAFLRNISHEIRTPLNGILGMFQILTDPDLSLKEKEKYFTHLQSSSDRLISTVTNYVDIALLDSGNMEMAESVFDPSVLLTRVYNKFLPLCEKKKLALTLLPPPMSGNFHIKSDEEMMQKALSHLVDNAIKFTGNGAVTVGFEKKGDVLEFFVKDTGEGIDDAANEIIYEHFVQGNQSNTSVYQGSGLGLSIAKKMIEKIGGKIRLESIRGKGSAFYFTIPDVKEM